jgi:molybdopterin synthase catalytic subunit
MSMDIVRVQEEMFLLSEVIDELVQSDPSVGAVVSFLGIARDRNQGQTVHDLWLEHYPGMTESAILGMVQQAKTRFDVLKVAVVHRVGKFKPTDPIVAVVVAGEHRTQAFDACQFVMDYLKIHAPFWKKEMTPGGAKWVDARVSDDAAAARWGLPPQS